MKALISTLKPNNNYGQILQAYASQEFLKENGFESYVFFHNRRTIKFVLRKLLEPIIIFGDFKDIKKTALKEKNLDKFISSKFNKIEGIKIEECIRKNNIDLLVIGSDQVWRKEYIKEYPEYYFPKFKYTQKIISIAASTGKDVDLNSDFYKKHFPKLKHFDLITCRESKLSDLIRHHFKLNASHVCDPTLLLSKSHYLELSKNSHLKNQLSSKKYILLYGLDLGLDENLKFKITQKTKLEIKSIDHVNDTIEDFLVKFEFASFVITDSFHGLQFSCIYDKRFIVKKNKKRGTLRFDSFLSLIKCEGSYYENSEDLLYKTDYFKPINYRKKLDLFISNSKSTIKNAL